MPEVNEVERETEVGPECRTSNPRRPVSCPYREAISHPCPLAHQAFFTFHALLSHSLSFTRAVFHKLCKSLDREKPEFA